MTAYLWSGGRFGRRIVPKAGGRSGRRSTRTADGHSVTSGACAWNLMYREKDAIRGVYRRNDVRLDRVHLRAE